MRQWRVGTWSMGLLLIALGIMMLVSQISGMTLVEQALKWWPVVLVILGLEILLHLSLSKEAEPKIKFDIFSMFIITTIVVVSLGIYATTNVLKNFGESSVFSSFSHQRSEYFKDNKDDFSTHYKDSSKHQKQ